MLKFEGEDCVDIFEYPVSIRVGKTMWVRPEATSFCLAGCAVLRAGVFLYWIQCCLSQYMQHNRVEV